MTTLTRTLLLALLGMAGTVQMTVAAAPPPQPVSVQTVPSPSATYIRHLDLPLAPGRALADATRDALRANVTPLNLSGLASPNHDLAPLTVKTSAGGVHVHLRQTLAGLSVWRGRVTAHLDRTGQHIRTLASTLRPMPDEVPATSGWVLSADAARARAEAVVGGPARPGSSPRPERMWVVLDTNSPPAPAWVVQHSSADPLGDWEVVLDARDGTLLHRDNRLAFVDGSGMGFKPDPLTVAEAEYGDPGFIDDDDANSPQLEQARRTVTLPEITVNGDVYHLSGPWVRLVDFESPFIDPPTPATPDGFDFTRDEDGFEDVNAYRHIDQFQRSLQSSGIDNLQAAPIEVDAHAAGGQDLSYYSPEFNRLAFGTGGVDDAEDADVLVHEYAHALHHDAVGGDVWGHDVRSLAEGLCDWWAADRSGYDFHADWVYNWDGHNEFWGGRFMTTPAVYPDQWSDDPDALYSNGTIFAHALWLIRDGLPGISGSERTRLMGEYFYFLTPGLPADAAALALLDAEDAVFDGEYADVIMDALLAKGFAYGEGQVAVTVTDALNDEVLPGATVTLLSDPPVPSGTTDQDGSCYFPSVPVGYWPLAVERDGFAPDTVNVTVVQTEMNFISVALQPYVIDPVQDELNGTVYIGGNAGQTLSFTGLRDGIQWAVRPHAPDLPPVTPWSLFGEPEFLDVDGATDLQGFTFLNDRYYIGNASTDPPSIRVYDREMSFVRAFLQPPGVEGNLHTLAHVDDMLWSIDSDHTLWAVDSLGATQATVPLPGGVEGTMLTWDATQQAFWISDGGDIVHAVTPDGYLVQTVSLPGETWRAMAVDPGDPDGYPLYLLQANGFDQELLRVNPFTGQTAPDPILVDSDDWITVAGTELLSGRLFPDADHLFYSLLELSMDGWRLRHYAVRPTLPWVSVVPAYGAGLDENDQVDVTVTMDASALDVGTHTGELVLMPVSGGASTRVTVTLEVTAVSAGESPGSGRQGAGGLPNAFAVSAPAPNPCNASTALTVTLPAAGQVTLRVHDILGREVDRLSWRQQVGTRRVSWRPPAGTASGVYLLRVDVPGHPATVRKVVVVK